MKRNRANSKTRGLLLAIITIGGIVGIHPSGTAADEVLFSGDFDARQVVASGAQTSPVKLATGTGLRVETGHNVPWPGVTIKAPAGHWDLSPFAGVAVTLRNCGTNAVTVNCRVDNSGADGTDHCVTGSLALEAGKSGTLNVPLRRTGDEKLDGKLFGMRGYPVGEGGAGTIDPRNITQFLVFVSRPEVGHSFEISTVQATGTYVPPTAWISDAVPFFPFIDTLGQYRHKDWPGKTRSVAELQTRREEERRELAQNPGPKSWDKYGGWATGPNLQTTGFFRTEKVNGKWWLIDPDGHLFFSHGIDCVRSMDYTPIEERENWFEAFPGREAEFAGLTAEQSVLKGHYAGKSVSCFSFLGANLRRKYGADWAEAYPKLVHQRLRNWGLNTIANWSDEHTYLLRLTPYTDSLGSGRAKMIEGSEGYWGKFPDVFDPSFAESLRKSMESKRGKSAGDPWCLGFFSDNEMSWGDDVSLALGALKSKASQAAKQALVGDLKAKYKGIGALNAAWGASFDSWDALLESRADPDTVKAHDDLAAFYTRCAEQYFRIVRDTIKGVAPKQLYLGCRFAWVNGRAAAAAAKYCDVVSYNLYQRSVADFQFNGGADVPLIIGEFHFGALDRGMFHTGLVPVASQKARAQAYKDYVLGALHHPQFVGCHWFQYADEPVTGRAYDEENYQIGFIDVADTPYAETIQASREIGDSLYRSAGARR